jgi:hypothetical protein
VLLCEALLQASTPQHAWPHAETYAKAKQFGSSSGSVASQATDSMRGSPWKLPYKTLAEAPKCCQICAPRTVKPMCNVYSSLPYTHYRSTLSRSCQTGPKSTNGAGRKVGYAKCKHQGVVAFMLYCCCLLSWRLLCAIWSR